MTNIISNKQRKTFVGIVSSDKNDKTITVVVETSKRHPMYHKSFKSTKKYHAHDETNQAKIGDKVEIISTHPFSALKRFRLLKIIESKTNKKSLINQENKKDVTKSIVS